MTTKGSITKEELSEIEEMRKRLAELEKALEDKKIPDDDSGREIQSDDYVTIMSLLPYTLTLSTKERGQGSVRKFSGFGETKRVLYKDLVEICENHRGFLESGYFIILDKDVIRTLGLDDIYDKILNREQIEKVLDTKTDALKLYESANQRQKQIIIEMLIKKLFEDPDSVNLNIVDKISRESGVNIREKVESIREYEELMEEIKKEETKK